MASEILIKGMVCERCISVIRECITNLGYIVTKTSLGKVSVNEDLDKSDFDKIALLLAETGFELVSNRQLRIVSQAKDLINEVFGENVRYDAKLKFSTLLSEKLHMNYNSISGLFTETEGITLEKFIITKRLEKVKALLVYTEFTLTEIAYITGFGSINHLSKQFKELTGFSPSRFKSIRSEKKKLSGQHAESDLRIV
jgi:AraC family transcriptional regulator